MGFCNFCLFPWIFILGNLLTWNWHLWPYRQVSYHPQITECTAIFLSKTVLLKDLLLLLAPQIFIASDGPFFVKFVISKKATILTNSSPSIWHLLNTVKSMVKISSFFVAFFENTNFNCAAYGLESLSSLVVKRLLCLGERFLRFKCCFFFFSIHPESVCHPFLAKYV